MRTRSPWAGRRAGSHVLGSDHGPLRTERSENSAAERSGSFAACLTAGFFAEGCWTAALSAGEFFAAGGAAWATRTARLKTTKGGMDRRMEPRGEGGRR